MLDEVGSVLEMRHEDRFTPGRKPGDVLLVRGADSILHRIGLRGKQGEVGEVDSPSGSNGGPATGFKRGVRIKPATTPP